MKRTQTFSYEYWSLPDNAAEMIEWIDANAKGDNVVGAKYANKLPPMFDDLLAKMVGDREVRQTAAIFTRSGDEVRNHIDRYDAVIFYLSGDSMLYVDNDQVPVVPGLVCRWGAAAWHRLTPGMARRAVVAWLQPA